MLTLKQKRELHELHTKKASLLNKIASYERLLKVDIERQRMNKLNSYYCLEVEYLHQRNQEQYRNRIKDTRKALEKISNDINHLEQQKGFCWNALVEVFNHD